MRNQLSEPPSGTYVVFDLETTGFKTPGDEIVEIAAVKCGPKGDIIDSFEALVKPGCKIGYGASQTHGITDWMVRDCPPMRDVLPEFLAFAGDCPLVGHNIRTFDMRFLDDACRRAGRPVMGNDIFDTLPLARKMLGSNTACGVEALVEHFGLEKRHAHRAMPDVLMENDVFLALRGMRLSRQEQMGSVFDMGPLYKDGTIGESEKDKGAQGTGKPLEIKKATCRQRALWNNLPAKTAPLRQPGLYASRMSDGRLAVEIEGYCPMMSVVNSYSFLHWKKNLGKWNIIVDKPCDKNFEVLRREAAGLGYSVFSGLGNER